MAQQLNRKGGRSDGTGSEPRIIKCSRCGCEWNVSINAYIPSSGYTCPHCTSRERQGNSIQEGEDMANIESGEAKTGIVSFEVDEGTTDYGLVYEDFNGNKIVLK